MTSELSSRRHNRLTKEREENVEKITASWCVGWLWVRWLNWLPVWRRCVLPPSLTEEILSRQKVFCSVRFSVVIRNDCQSSLSRPAYFFSELQQGRHPTKARAKTKNRDMRECKSQMIFELIKAPSVSADRTTYRWYVWTKDDGRKNRGIQDHITERRTLWCGGTGFPGWQIRLPAEGSANS
jgi:hypothetical protein